MIPNLAIHLKVSDFEWTPAGNGVEEPPPAPALAVKTTFYCRDENGQLVEAGLYFEHLYEKRMNDPAWWEEQRRKQAAKAERRKARLAERRQRKVKKAA